VSLEVEVEPGSLSATRRLRESFSGDEIRRLYWLKGTVVAEQHLVPPEQPCTDHGACRRLAFALWLYSTGRLSEDTVERGDPDDSTPS